MQRLPRDAESEYWCQAHEKPSKKLEVLQVKETNGGKAVLQLPLDTSVLRYGFKLRAHRGEELRV